MRFLVLTLALAAAFVAPAQAQPRARAAAWYTQADNFAPRERVEVRIRNDLDTARRNNPVVITRAQLAALPDVHEFAITLVDPSRAGRTTPSDELLRRQGGHEARAETNGAWIPYQLDDLDSDGQWDELFFMTDIGPRETKTFYLYIGYQHQGWYAHRTHAAIGSYVRHTVPFWEGENIGWKLWFPDSIDVFGKRRPLLMSQHLYMENLDGYGVGQTNADWGSDIMEVGNSFGGGGVGLFEDPAHPDVVSRARFTPANTAGTNFNTGPRGDSRYSFVVIANGPLRSMIRARTMNWNSGHGRYELEQIFSSYAGESYATSRVRFSTFAPANAGTHFAAGIRKHINESSHYQQRGVVISGAPEAIRGPDDGPLRPNGLIVDYVGSALVVRDTYQPRYVYVPGYQGNHTFAITPNAERSFEYLIAAGWSEGVVNKTPAEFQDYVVRTAREYNAPLAFVSSAVRTAMSLRLSRRQALLGGALALAAATPAHALGRYDCVVDQSGAGDVPTLGEAFERAQQRGDARFASCCAPAFTRKSSR